MHIQKVFIYIGRSALKIGVIFRFHTMTQPVDVKNELWRQTQQGDLESIKSFIDANFPDGDKSWLGLSHSK